jgi:hypothetical protein
LSAAVHFPAMKHLMAIVAVLCVLAMGAIYVTNQGNADRDVPGKTTDTGRSKLGDE